MTNFCEIELTKICSNPKNPRRHHDVKKLQELAASIKQKGVIEPIIVRPMKGKKTDFEIVAGERRFRASAAAGLATIPAIVRDLTDDEAYDFMLIENLQREDLTDREEAESFKAYIGRHGESGIPDLAEKTGISPAYIRSRVRVLALPPKILKGWSDGKLSFGHVVQLLRVAKDEAVLAKTLAWTLNTSYDRRSAETVESLRRYIDDKAPALKAALFKTEGVCDRCGSNSAVQKELFDISTDKIRCHNPSCFKQRQLKAIAEGWKTTPLGKSCGTNRAIINDDQRVAYHGFYSSPPTGKCRACPDFATFLALDGEVRDRQVCVGNEKCHSALGRQRGQEKRSDRNPEAPRAKWHGVYFKDKFIRARLAGLLDEEAAKPSAERAAKLCLYALLKSHREARKAVGAALGMKARDEWRGPGEKLDLAIINTMTKEDILRNAILAVKAVMLEGMVEMGGGFNDIGAGGRERQLVGTFLGIDVAKEFAVDKDYLDKKTKAEILAFGKTFKLFDKNVDPVKLKKGELVKVVLAHGEKLVGLVPAEILK